MNEWTKCQGFKRTLAMGVLLTLVFTGFSFSGTHAQVNTHAQVKKGKASYYAKRATGSTTANGEKLHHDSMTCAHPTLPFGTLLKVTNLSNLKSVIVRVNDRGPFVGSRIIDLSWGAAKEIDMLKQGVVRVEIEPAYRIRIPLAADPIKIKMEKIVESPKFPDTLQNLLK